MDVRGGVCRLNLKIRLSGFLSVEGLGFRVLA